MEAIIFYNSILITPSHDVFYNQNHTQARNGTRGFTWKNNKHNNNNNNDIEKRKKKNNNNSFQVYVLIKVPLKHHKH